MLLVLDVGNTNTVLGVFELTRDAQGAGNYGSLIAHWRVSTTKSQTVDEYGVLFRNLFAMNGLEVSSVQGTVISSVVPPLDSTLREVCERYFQIKPLFIEPGVKTGMPVHYDNPAEVGADRIVNSVAAFEKYGGPCIIVDFGTATTFDAVSAKGEYLGGVITPGIGISADALFERTARLPRVDIRKPSRVLATNTVNSLQSGLYYGYLGLIDGILERLIAELGGDVKVVATGGLASLMSGGSKYIREVDELLTLEGLRIIYERHHDVFFAAARIMAQTRCNALVDPTATRRLLLRSAIDATLGVHATRRSCAWPVSVPTSVENYFNYFTEIEEHFQRRRGTITLLSPLDWALMEIWKDAGIPLEAVLRGIDAAFDKWERRPKRTRKVNGLAYCAQEVLASAEEMKEAAVGAERPVRRAPGLEPRR